MKRFLLLTSVVVGVVMGVACLGWIPTAPEARAEPVVVDSSVFYEALAPHGDWIYLRPYGWVWSPSPWHCSGCCCTRR